MSGWHTAIDIIKSFQGFNEKAFADPDTGDYPYTLGFGTQYYPDGEPVKQGQCCTYQKAMEYLLHETNEIRRDLEQLNLGLDASMTEALISFAHSIGWQPFLYSQIIDCCEQENWLAVAQEIKRWVFDGESRIIGSLLARRRVEANLFLQEVDGCPGPQEKCCYGLSVTTVHRQRRYGPSACWRNRSILTSLQNSVITLKLMSYRFLTWLRTS